MYVYRFYWDRTYNATEKYQTYLRNKTSAILFTIQNDINERYLPHTFRCLPMLFAFRTSPAIVRGGQLKSK